MSPAYRVGWVDMAQSEKKEKKPRPAAPPPPPALATAALLVRGAAAKVLGLRPGACGGELQPVWVTEPGIAKVTISIEGSSRTPFPKEELHGALIDAIEAETEALVAADSDVSVFELDRESAETCYGDAMYDAKSAKGDVLKLAYLPGAALVEIPANWSLCATTGACGRVAFQKAVDPASKKKPETMILYKKKQLMVRFEVANAEAASGDVGGSQPSSDAVRELDTGAVTLRVPGVDTGGSGNASRASASTAARARGNGRAPPFPFPAAGVEASDPAAVYWKWFEKGLAERLRKAAAAAGRGKADVLARPTAAGLVQTCADTFKRPLGETEIAHLEVAPVSAEWLASLLKDVDFPAVSKSGDGEEAEENEDDMVVDPWNVKGKIDYKNLIVQFGSTEISPELLARIERLTVGKGRVKALHPWLRRGIFYSHRDLDRICTCVEQGVPFYLYTGRGPSSAAMHLGHLIPFMMTQWLQEAFDVPLVIQMTDDEKFLWKGEWDVEEGDNLMHYRSLTTENAKDIIACGFDKKKTFIFSDLEYMVHMYPNVVRIWKAIPYNQAKNAFGFKGDNNIGQSAFPAVQAAPSFPSTFDIPLKGRHNLACLIPCAIDQDPYFRLTRDIAHKLVPKEHPLKGKPALIHSKFFPPLQGAMGKMSASDDNSAVFLTETAEQIDSKIMRYAFSGGRVTAKEQRELGADLDIDVSYQWLRFFLDDDEEVERIGREYGCGQGDYWNTGSVKKRLITELQRIVAQHQERRSKITDQEIEEWMSVRELDF